MLVKKRCGFLLPVLSVLGCGSDVESTSDWMLGTFSNRSVPDNTVGLTSVVRHEFREDGTLVRTIVRGCGADRQEVVEQYDWRRDGDALVLVTGVQEGDSFEEWRITPGDACDTLEVERLQDGVVWGSFTLMRGAVCMSELPPCGGVECPSCETVWCDEQPPTCDD
jgi:hypothetical protein